MPSPAGTDAVTTTGLRPGAVLKGTRIVPSSALEYSCPSRNSRAFITFFPASSRIVNR